MTLAPIPVNRTFENHRIIETFIMVGLQADHCTHGAAFHNQRDYW